MREMTRRPSRRQFLRAVSIGGTSVIAGCTGFIGDEPEIPERSANAPPLKWIADIDDNTFGCVAPKMDGETIHCGDNFHVRALNKSDGSEKWRYEIDPPNDNICYSGRICVADGITYTQGCGNVYAFDKDGNIEWVRNSNKSLREPITAPAISSTALFFGGYRLVRRDRVTGKVQWESDISGLTQATPALSDDYIFVSTSTGQLQAFSRLTGELRFTLKTEADITSAPIVSDGAVFFGTSISREGEKPAGYLYAVDIRKEGVRWRVETGGITNNLPPVVYNETVITTNKAGVLYAISTTDGSIQWKFNTMAKNPAVPRVGDGLVYVASGQTVRAIDIDTGEQQWHMEWDSKHIGGRDSSLLVTTDVLYVGTFDSLYAFSLS